jgi:hypothetical protein
MTSGPCCTGQLVIHSLSVYCLSFVVCGDIVDVACLPSSGSGGHITFLFAFLFIYLFVYFTIVAVDDIV